MLTHQHGEQRQEVLELSIEGQLLYVSYLSSLLRVIQAALREAANYRERTKTYFQARPQPVLVLSGLESNEGLVLRFTFADPSNLASMADLSSGAFKAFMSHFTQMLKKQPQPGLWGFSARMPRPKEYASELDRRVDEVRMELGHFDRVTVAYGDQRIQIDGDRVEIESTGSSTECFRLRDKMLGG